MTVKELRKYLKEGASIMITCIDDKTIFGLRPGHLLKPADEKDEFDNFTFVKLEICRYGLIIYCKKENKQ